MLNGFTDFVDSPVGIGQQQQVFGRIFQQIAHQVVQDEARFARTRWPPEQEILFRLHHAVE